MAQGYPNQLEDLSQTYFGELAYQFSGKVDNVTQTLDKTYFGELLSGNDFGIVEAQSFTPIIMMWI